MKKGADWRRGKVERLPPGGRNARSNESQKPKRKRNALLLACVALSLSFVGAIVAQWRLFSPTPKLTATSMSSPTPWLTKEYIYAGNRLVATDAQAVNPIDDARFFVRQQYLDFLGREPEPEGWDYWTSQILSCGDAACVHNNRVTVSKAFFISQEFQDTGYFVYRMYKMSYNRRLSFNEFTTDRSTVVGGPQLEGDKVAFINNWLQRPQFQQAYPDSLTAAQFVDNLNANTGSSLSQSERDALVQGFLNGNETRATVLRKMADNAVFMRSEYNTAFVVMQYFGYLRRSPDLDGLNFWLNVINNGDPNNYFGMVCSFITSSEYQLRFGPVTRSNQDCGSTPPPPPPPQVAITSPASGTVFNGPAEITIGVSASPIGSVAKVEFFQGQTKIGQDNTAPYSLGWSNMPSGTYSLGAVATYGSGTSTSSNPITVTVTGSPQVATITLGSLNQTYNGSPRNATATTSPAGLNVSFSYSQNGQNISAPINAGSYQVTATINNPNYQGSATGTLVITKATATITLNQSSLTQPYNGLPRNATATTNPSGLSVSFSYSQNGQSVSAPTNVGSYTVAATINDANYQGSASGTLTITKATATITLGSLNQTYNGSPRNATATTSPSGLNVGFAYNQNGQSVPAPTNVGSYTVAATINDANYQGSATGTLSITNATATITLSNLAQTYDGSSHSASVSTNPANLSVSLSYAQGGTSVPAPTSAGSYTVSAAINDNNYQGSNSSTLVIGKATPTISWSNPADIPSGTPLGNTQLNATASAAQVARIIFTSDRAGNDELYAMNADGSNAVRLTNNPTSDSYAQWSADGRKLVFVSDRDGNSEIYVMNADGTNQTRLTNNAVFDHYPAWSPNGSKIAFASDRDGNREIYVMNADGSGQTRLTNNTAVDSVPMWSPNGAKLAFHSNRDGGLMEVYVMNADGSGQTRLTNNPALDFCPVWSPDGARILFLSERDGNSEIYAMNADGSGQINLTNNPAWDASSISWSPDGTKIVFVSSRDGNDEIYQMNANGSSQTRLTNNPAKERYPAWRPTSNQPPGAFAYTPPAGTVLGVGSNQTLATTFTATDTANYNTAGATARINVIGCPNSAGSTFTSSPSSIVPGSQSTLSWNVPGATSVNIAGVGSFPTATGNVAVSPAATTTYTLTATGVSGCSAVTLQTTVMVQACPTAAETQFTSRQTSAIGESEAIGGIGSVPLTWLSWNAPNATRISIYTLGLCPDGGAACGETTIIVSSDSSGSVSVNPRQTTTYVLVVEGPSSCKSFEKRVIVTVGSGDGGCDSDAHFQLDVDSKDCVRAASEITLSWDVPTATKVQITDDSGVNYGAYESSGRISVTPESGTTYILTAYTDAKGDCSQFTLTTTVEICPLR